MPGRNIPLVTSQIYHIFNRGVASQPIFLNKRDYDCALETLFYYQNKITPVRFSIFRQFSISKKKKILQDFRFKKELLCQIITHCLMPNHFHLILEQKEGGGISKSLSDFTNSYTRYFNTKNKRAGTLLQGRFKAVRVETTEQLIHLSRYIHLNPYTSFIVKSLKDLYSYQYSSLGEYLGTTKINFCNKKKVLDNFGSTAEYKKFVGDQADYQRSLEEFKHLSLEEQL